MGSKFCRTLSFLPTDAFLEVWMPQETLTITDNRTGQSYTLPVENGTIRAMDLRKIKTGADDFGLMTYDPAFMNTASCKSAITYIDGDKGILRYRGYPIEVLS
jgi:citrate synthase